MPEKVRFEALPRGRHRLTREQVRASQRGRLLLGMAEAVAEKGYARTSVADVLKRGGVSRETFYQHFSDKEACFLAALDQGTKIMEELFDRELVADASEPPLLRFERALDIYLTTLAAEPALARVFFLEAYAAGPAAQRKRYAVQDRFVAAVYDNFRDDPAWQDLPDLEFACRAIVAAVGQLVAAALVAGRPEELTALRDPVIALIRHFIGAGDRAGGAAPE